MSKIMEELLKEQKYETTVEIVNRMLEAGILSLEQIASISGLNLEEVTKLA